MDPLSSARTRRCVAVAAAAAVTLLGAAAQAQTLSNSTFKATIGSNGEISSLQLTGDTFPTNYVLNATNAPGQNTADHAWVGELMFNYRLGSGAWTPRLDQPVQRRPRHRLGHQLDHRQRTRARPTPRASTTSSWSRPTRW